MRCYEERTAQAMEHVNWLIEKGHEDVHSAHSLLEFVFSVMAKIDAEAVAGTLGFAHAAGHRVHWPVRYADHPDVVKSTNEFLREIKLGSQMGIGLSNRKSFQWGKEKDVVVSLYTIVFEWSTHVPSQAMHKHFPSDIKWHQLAADLPKITRQPDVLRRWWLAIDALLEEEWGDIYENWECFERHWNNVTIVDLPRSKKRAIVRRDIKKALKQGLKSIVQESSPESECPK